MGKIVLLGFLSLLLGACSAEENTDKEVENEIEVIADETQEDSIVSPNLTTTFKPKVTELRELTEEDEQLYEALLEAITEYSGSDRDAVYMVALENQIEPKELWETWIEIIDAKQHGIKGSNAILTEDFNNLLNEIVEKNIMGSQIKHNRGTFDSDADGRTTTARLNLDIDGKSHTVSFVIDHQDDYKTAEIIEFRVDGEDLEL